MFIFKETADYSEQFKSLHAEMRVISRKKRRHSCYIKNEVIGGLLESFLGDLEVWATVSSTTKDSIECILYIERDGGKEPISSIILKKNAIELKLLSDISTSSTARVLVMELLSQETRFLMPN